jgi:hypothetical protein
MRNRKPPRRPFAASPFSPPNQPLPPSPPRLIIDFGPAAEARQAALAIREAVMFAAGAATASNPIADGLGLHIPLAMQASLVLISAAERAEKDHARREEEENARRAQLSVLQLDRNKMHDALLEVSQFVVDAAKMEGDEMVRRIARLQELMVELWGGNP